MVVFATGRQQCHAVACANLGGCADEGFANPVGDRTAAAFGDEHKMCRQTIDHMPSVAVIRLVSWHI